MKFKDLKARISRLFGQLKEKGLNYWLIVIVLLVFGTLAGEQLGQQNMWIHLRYRIYPYLQRLAPGPKYPSRTVLVLIDDEAFWKGTFERRLPLKRDSLAKVVRALDSACPAIIGLDLDLRSPVPQEHKAEVAVYQKETEDLLSAIKEASHNRPIILATTISSQGDGFVLNPNIFDDYDFEGGKVSTGYAALPKDVRQVPLAYPLKNGKNVLSFSGAIVKTLDARVISEVGPIHEESRGFPYGTFYKQEDFVKKSAAAVIDAPVQTLRDELQGKVVIVGGSWHTGAYRAGREAHEDDPYAEPDGRVDVNFTPAGFSQGIYIQANYVEALLYHQVHAQIPGWLGIVIEVLCSIGVAIIFALPGPFRSKILGVVLLCLVLILLTYFMWQNLGLFFDFFIPMVLLAAHAPIERLRESKKELRESKKRIEELEEEVRSLKRIPEEGPQVNEQENPGSESPAKLAGH